MLIGNEPRVVDPISEGKLDIGKCAQDLVLFKAVNLPDEDRALHWCGVIEDSM